MENANSAQRKLKAFGVRGAVLLFAAAVSVSCVFLRPCFSQEIKKPNVAGQFYPADKAGLGQAIDGFLAKANPDEFKGGIFAIISPHAGYGFSGQTAAFGYKLIQAKPYKTAVIIGISHHYPFKGVSVYPSGKFRTPLGDSEIDSDFAERLIDQKLNISFVPQAFAAEHSVEVQIPFLQKAASAAKIVPVVIGDCDFKILQDLAAKLVSAIGQRNDVLLVASTDMCHSYDYEEAELVDKITLSYLQKMSAEEIYNGLAGGMIQMCGGLPVVTTVIAATALGHNKLKILNYTNSGIVTGNKKKGAWTVGYVSAVIDKEECEVGIMLNEKQKKRLLEIARRAIEEYAADGSRIDFTEDDPKLKETRGAFVTLHKAGELRGCIGSIVGQKPLYRTVRDMAIESAAEDPRFMPVGKNELKDIEIEISVLSPLKKIKDINEFQLGTHGVLIRRGWNSGVFLPQVAKETGWTKEKFLSNLCGGKAGLAPDAWKDPKTEIFIFSALVFSESQAR